MSTSSLEAVLERLAQAISQRDDARHQLRIIRGVVDAYLNHGLGGGGRGVCLRIKQILEEK